MIYSLFNVTDGQDRKIEVDGILVQPSTQGILEGSTIEGIEDIYFGDSSPFQKGNMPCVTLDKEGFRLEDWKYSVWLDCVSTPVDEKFCASHLAIRFFTNNWQDDMASQVGNAIDRANYWENCQDFDY